MVVPAQLYARGHQDRINLYAAMPFKFKQQIHRTGIASAPAQDPTAAAKNGTGQRLHQPSRLFRGDASHLEGPRNNWDPAGIGDCSELSHDEFIGAGRSALINVR